jgi:hypothetical protein
MLQLIQEKLKTMQLTMGAGGMLSFGTWANFALSLSQGLICQKKILQSHLEKKVY